MSTPAFDPPHHERHPAPICVHWDGLEHAAVRDENGLWACDRPLSLVDCTEALAGFGRDLDTLAEHLVVHRRDADALSAVDLRAVEDDVWQAWAKVQHAMTALREYVAVRS